MKTRFTNTEIGTIATTIATNTNLTLRINKCGNLDVEHKNTDEVHFVFYKYADGFTIRRRLGTYSGLAQHGGVMNGGKKFSTIKEVANYFSNYMENHKTSLYTSYRKTSYRRG